MEELRKHLHSRMELFEKNGYCKFPVFLKSTRKMIGTCGVGPFEYQHNQELEVGTRFEKQSWGKGFGTEAKELIFNYLRDKLSIDRVYAYIVPDNKRSQSGVIKMGFKQIENIDIEGTLHYLYVLELKSVK